MNPVSPGELEVSGTFRLHLGPRFQGAGLTVQFHYNQIPGIDFKANVREEYRAAILKGLNEGMTLRFPNFPEKGSVWITAIADNDIDSSQMAFYKAARMVIEQAFALSTIRGEP
jgi:hypothetical protein